MTMDAVVLGVHVCTQGFGWILLEPPSTPLDWGVVERRKDRNERCLVALAKLVERYPARVVVLERYVRASVSATGGTWELYRKIVRHTRGYGLRVRMYHRADIQQAFECDSRHEVALAVAQKIPAIRPRLPKKRAVWESEKPGMALFNAAAVALTHCRKQR